MSGGDWLALVPVAGALVGAIYQAGRLTRSVQSLEQRVGEVERRMGSLERWWRGDRRR